MRGLLVFPLRVIAALCAGLALLAGLGAMVADATADWIRSA